MSQISEMIPDTDQDRLQNFISDSRWDAQAVMDRTAIEVNAQIGDNKNACLLLDECGFVKKGDKSVGVARQWLGRVGKVENGQVGVFAALCNNNDASLINARLYLPLQWTNDKQRCKKAGIAEECMVFKTKEEIALDLVKHAIEIGVNFGYVGADAGYGKGLTFIKELQRMGVNFVVDIHSDYYVFTRPVTPYLPQKEPSARGPIPKRYIVDQEAVRVDNWIKSQKPSSWRKIKIRKGTKGTVQYEYFCNRVWIWEKDTENVFCWYLIVRRNIDTKGDYKYSLSNVAVGTPIEKLAFMQAQRFWVERTFEDAKSECGMADYEVQGWIGWHHHMALVMMAQSFLLDERILNRNQYPLLSCSDVVRILCAVIPSNEISLEKVVEMMVARHRMRQKAIDSSYKMDKH